MAKGMTAASDELAAIVEAVRPQLEAVKEAEARIAELEGQYDHRAVRTQLDELDRRQRELASGDVLDAFEGAIEIDEERRRIAEELARRGRLTSALEAQIRTLRQKLKRDMDSAAGRAFMAVATPRLEAVAGLIDQVVDELEHLLDLERSASEAIGAAINYTELNTAWHNVAGVGNSVDHLLDRATQFSGPQDYHRRRQERNAAGLLKTVGRVIGR